MGRKGVTEEEGDWEEERGAGEEKVEGEGKEKAAGSEEEEAKEEETVQEGSPPRGRRRFVFSFFPRPLPSSLLFACFIHRSQPSERHDTPAPCTYAHPRLLPTHIHSHLRHTQVATSPEASKRAFLEKKGLNSAEIAEAFVRVPQPPPAAPSLPTTATTATGLEPRTSAPAHSLSGGGGPLAMSLPMSPPQPEVGAVQVGFIRTTALKAPGFR